MIFSFKNFAHYFDEACVGKSDCVELQVVKDLHESLFVGKDYVFIFNFRFYVVVTNELQVFLIRFVSVDFHYFFNHFFNIEL